MWSGSACSTHGARRASSPPKGSRKPEERDLAIALDLLPNAKDVASSPRRLWLVGTCPAGVRPEISAVSRIASCPGSRNRLRRATWLG
jgi:hypothetical protein